MQLKSLLGFIIVSVFRPRSCLYINGNLFHKEHGYLKYVYENIQKLHKRITMVQGNVKNILNSINEWGSVPMYKRKDGNRKLCLDIVHAEKQMKIQNDRIDITKELIQRGMQENFNLFFNFSCIADGNESNDRAAKCNHNLFTKRVQLMRAIGKSSDDLGKSDVIFLHLVKYLYLRTN